MMIERLAAMIGGIHLPRPGISPSAGTAEGSAAVVERVALLERDPYLAIADADERLISVFDDLKYDRADLDMLTGPMRRHAVSALAPLGFGQVSGNVLENHAAGVRVLIPKIHALGASPFDAARYLKRGPRDYLLLTPTQAACQLIDVYACEEAVERIRTLIERQPINLYKIVDHLERTESHRRFRSAIGYLKYVQRNVIESDPMCRRRPLR